MFETTLTVRINMRFLHIISMVFVNLIFAVGRRRLATLEKEVEQEVTYNKSDTR